jgi:hypothetical protein
MTRKGAYGGLTALILLAVAGIGIVVLLVALVVPGVDEPEAPKLVIDKTPLVRIEDKVITRYQMEVATEHHLRRRPKEGFPYHGILLDWMYLAAWETILERHGKGITPDDVKRERERQERSSKDKDSLKKIADFLDRYPGMYEAIMVRPVLANNAIHKFHGSRANQAEAWDKAEAGLKEALRDPDFFRRIQESQPDMYRRVDSRDPMPPGPPEIVHPPHLIEGERKRIIEFVERELATVAPREVRPVILDEEGVLSILRLIERTPEHAVFEVVSYRKTLYDIWFEGELKKLKGEILDERARKELKDNLKENVFRRWLFGD